MDYFLHLKDWCNVHAIVRKTDARQLVRFFLSIGRWNSLPVGDTRIISKSSLIVTQVTGICVYLLMSFTYPRIIYARARVVLTTAWSVNGRKKKEEENWPIPLVSSRGQSGDPRGILSTRESSYATTRVRDWLVTCLPIFAAKRGIAIVLFDVNRSPLPAGCIKVTMYRDCN